MSHPIFSLYHSLRDKGNCKLEFSRYIHGGNGITIDRHIFHVNALIIKEWLPNMLGMLTVKEELALHSKVEYNGSIYHIPMVDFLDRHKYNDIFKQMEHITKALDMPLELYDSGQSFHGYYFGLLAQDKWHGYLGSLLLCNKPNEPALIDSRWVGHSLEHGFSALRWSNNSGLYKSLPRLV